MAWLRDIEEALMGRNVAVLEDCRIIPVFSKDTFTMGDDSSIPLEVINEPLPIKTTRGTALDSPAKRREE